MSQGERHPAQPTQQPEVATGISATPVPMIGDDQWNKDITGILTTNANNAVAELGFTPSVLHALKDAGSDIAKLKAEKKVLEHQSRDLAAHLALANNRIDFAKQDTHSQWKEVVYYREKYHVLQRQYQEILRAHSACANGPPEQPYIHLLQELEKLQDMYRHILGQNATLKFEVQRLMQQCVNGGLIPPPQNYAVTPVPALQPPALQSAPTRRVSEPAAVSHPQQTQGPPMHTQGGLQPGPPVRQFVSPPSNTYAPNRPAVSSPMIVAGPTQAYNYHRTQFPQPQQVPAQMMPPPQQPQQTLPQQAQPSVSQQHTPAIRPRPVIDLTASDDERIPKRPRMASDPNVYSQLSPGLSGRPQYYVQAPIQTPYQPQQRNPEPRPQMVPTDRTQGQPIQTHYPQRSMTAPNSYLHVLSPTSPPPRANSFSSVPTPPTSAPPVMDAYRALAAYQIAGQTQGNLPVAQGQVQGVSQPQQQVDTGPALPVSVASQNPSGADAGPNVATVATPVEAPAEQSTGTPLASTPAAPPPDSVPVSPQVMSGQVQGGESSLPPLTEEQTSQMRSELADSMFTEPEEGDEMQARVCEFCDRRRELGILTAPLQQFLKPTTEEMYLHLQADHKASLDMAEREWKMELFGAGPLKTQQ